VRSSPFFFALLVATSSACGLTYQQRQDRFRERYETGCEILRTAPAARPAAAAAESSKEDPERDDIDAAFSTTKDEVQRCYLEALELWADMDGLVTVNITIQPDGSVTSPAVAMYHSTIAEASVGCCIARVVHATQFPKPRAGKPLAVSHVFDLETAYIKLRFGGGTDVGQPQPASGTEIHRTW
jgi:hypothetical protein